MDIIELGEMGGRPEEEQEGQLEWDESTDSFRTPTTEPYEDELWSSGAHTGPTERERIRQSVRDNQAVLNVLFEGEYNPSYGPESRYLFDNTKVLFVDGKIEGVTFIGKKVAEVKDGKLVFAKPSAYLTRFQDAAMRAEDEFEATPLAMFHQTMEEEEGGVEDIPLVELRDIARLQLEIEDSFLPEVNGETRAQRTKRVMERVFRRPRLSENDLLRLERFKSWARRNLFLISGIAIVVASALTAVILVIKGSLRAGSKKLKEAKRPKPVDPSDDPLAPIINWIVYGGSKALNFASQHLWVLALVGVLLVMRLK